ncbi:acetolactate synthase small subunit [Mongoliitalea daihaiensis]|jgi:acetolactate synthase I/III small subunit|uniref:acetolactate synthase small subunit n=1 Tax=Mongoliitalea daihaiensis TaxID=2782006 RepID=UPI001F383813|nr:acetolactate synthase small subunit [Mongoliitalea daihaiensis]UJP65502.1 acetolactate synthase small subunit [Mongoliitalea daihaiensis]
MNRYTILIYTENFIGILNRITIIFTRRGINIDALTASESRLEGIHKITMEVSVTEQQMVHLAGQIEKIVDVIKAYYFRDDEVVYQEIALYKVPTESLDPGLEKVIRQFNAHIIAAEKEFVVVEFTGHKQDTQALLEILKPFNLLEFSRSGRVAIAKPKFSVQEYLNNQTYNH